MRSPSRATADAVLGGDPITASPAWQGVAGFLDNLRLESAAMSAPAPSLVLEARLDHPTAGVVRTAEAGARRQTSVLSRLRPVAALCAASCVTFGGLAAAGALPGPLQHASASFGSHFGVGIPGATRSPAVPPAAARGADSSAKFNAAGLRDVESPPSVAATGKSPALAPADDTKRPVAVPLSPTSSLGSSPLRLSLRLDVLPTALDPKNVAPRAVRHAAAPKPSPENSGQQSPRHRRGLSRISSRER